MLLIKLNAKPKISTKPKKKQKFFFLFIAKKMPGKYINYKETGKFINFKGMNNKNEWKKCKCEWE